MIPAMPTIDSLRRFGVLGATLLLVAVACSNGDDGGAATAAPSEALATDAPAVTNAPTTTDAPTASEVPVATDAPDASAGPVALDFGSGSGSITLGDETFAFAIGPGAGICRDVFDIIQATGSVDDGRDVDGDFSISPLDWETFTDGRYDPPSVGLAITSTGDDNANWIADAAWAEQNDKVGMSQVDAYEKEGLVASGTATFADAWDTDKASVQGSFEISCADA